jgi:hypothetical protein
MNESGSGLNAREGVVRQDLLQKSVLLGALGKLIHVTSDKNLEKNPIVIAAPHHAGQISPFVSGHDKETGRIAEFIAREMNARAVVAEELRTFIDINKDPMENLSQYSPEGALAAKYMRLFYQSQIFHGIPNLVIEIHGHVKGNYDIEVSSGSELTSDVIQDKPAIEGLSVLRETLTHELKGSDISAGVFPLDRDVYYQAKKTYTFLRIERLRELGLPISGLHIEIHKKLRELILSCDERGAKPPDFLRALVAALWAYLKSDRISAKKELDRKDILLDLFSDPAVSRAFRLLRDKPFIVQMAPKDMVKKDAILLNGKDLAGMNLEEGENIWVSNNIKGREAIEVECLKSDRRPGTAGLARRFRSTLGVDKGEGIFIGKMLPIKIEASESLQDLFYIRDVIEDPAADQETIFLPTKNFERYSRDESSSSLIGLQLANSDKIVKGHFARMTKNCEDPGQDKGVCVSKDLAYRGDLIVGDVVLLRPERAESTRSDKNKAD